MVVVAAAGGDAAMMHQRAPEQRVGSGGSWYKHPATKLRKSEAVPDSRPRQPVGPQEGKCGTAQRVLRIWRGIMEYIVHYLFTCFPSTDELYTNMCHGALCVLPVDSTVLRGWRGGVLGAGLEMVLYRNKYM